MKVAKRLFLGVFLTSGLLVACGDDDSSQAICGNGQVEGDEACDQSDFNGATCQTAAGMNGGTLACTSTCTIDTSGCRNIPENCGDAVIDAGEACDGTNLNDETCQTVGDYVGGTLDCDIDCTFITTGCTPAPECGNGVAEAGEDCDGTDLDDQTCDTIPGSYEGGTLACNTATCEFDVSDCEIAITCGNGVEDAGEDCDGTNLFGSDCQDAGDYLAGGTLACTEACLFDTVGCLPDTSAQIATVIAAANGTLSPTLPVEEAYVTYVKPRTGNDVAGIFVQKELLGPALFVVGDATTFGMTVNIGDEVSFRVATKATTNGLPQATVISGFTRLSTGHDITPITQDLSAAADIVSAIATYQAEIITLDATITGAFAFSGSGHMAAPIATEGLPAGDTNFTLRLPQTLSDASQLQPGCTVTVTEVPLWRYTTGGGTPRTLVQVSPYYAADIAVNSCPEPRVLSALSTGDSTVVVTFDAAIDPTSVLSNGSQFTFDASDTGPALTATSAAVTGLNQVTVGTTTQATALWYHVTAAHSVESVLGMGIDPAYDTATFKTWDPSTIGYPRINELFYNPTSSPETGCYIELIGPPNFDLTGYRLLHINGNGGATISTITLDGSSMSPDGYFLIAQDLTVVTPLAPLYVKISTSADLQNGPDNLQLRQGASTIIDAVGYATFASGDVFAGEPAGDRTQSAPDTGNNNTRSLCRIPNGVDTDNNADDFQLCNTKTPGVANVP